MLHKALGVLLAIGLLICVAVAGEHFFSALKTYAIENGERNARGAPGTSVYRVDDENYYGVGSLDGRGSIILQVTKGERIGIMIAWYSDTGMYRIGAIYYGQLVGVEIITQEKAEEAAREIFALLLKARPCTEKEYLTVSASLSRMPSLVKHILKNGEESQSPFPETRMKYVLTKVNVGNIEVRTYYVLYFVTSGGQNIPLRIDVVREKWVDENEIYTIHQTLFVIHPSGAIARCSASTIVERKNGEVLDMIGKPQPDDPDMMLSGIIDELLRKSEV